MALRLPAAVSPRLAALVAAAAVIAAAIVAAVAGRACSRSRGASGRAGPPAEAEVALYARRIAALGAIERAALDELAAAAGDRYAGDELLLVALRERTLPRYRSFVAALATIHPRSEAVGRFHARLRRAAAEQLLLLERLEQAVAGGDGVSVLQLNREQRRLEAEMDALVAEYRAGLGGHGATIAGATPAAAPPAAPPPAPPPSPAGRSSADAPPADPPPSPAGRSSADAPPADPPRRAPLDTERGI